MTTPTIHHSDETISVRAPPRHPLTAGGPPTPEPPTCRVRRFMGIATWRAPAIRGAVFGDTLLTSSTSSYVSADEAVASDGDVERHQVLDILTLVVDDLSSQRNTPAAQRDTSARRDGTPNTLWKSLEILARLMRFRARHRDHCTAFSALLARQAATGLY